MVFYLLLIFTTIQYTNTENKSQNKNSYRMDGLQRGYKMISALCCFKTNLNTTSSLILAISPTHLELLHYRFLIIALHKKPHKHCFYIMFFLAAILASGCGCSHSAILSVQQLIEQTHKQIKIQPLNRHDNHYAVRKITSFFALSAYKNTGTNTKSVRLAVNDLKLLYISKHERDIWFKCMFSRNCL